MSADERGNGWVDVLAVDDVAVGGCAVVRRGPKQIAVFRLSEDELQAVDNRCPHEGYPLKTGSVEGGLVTCEWHNWKFRLRDGACVLGGEDVRHYPLEIRAGRVRLDLTDPPIEDALPAIESSLRSAFDEADWAWAARDVERLLDAGRTPEQVLGFVADWTASHAKYGFEHGLAAAADLGALLSEAGDDVDIALVRALISAVEPHVRRPARDLPEPVELGVAPDWEAVGGALRAHVEAQEVEQAEALVRGAIVAGVPPPVAFGWMTALATDHFLDFAHQHIYAVKSEELLEQIGWDHAHPVLTSLVTGIAVGTREDLLPYMGAYRKAMEAYEPHLSEWGRAEHDDGAPLDAGALVAAVLDGDVADGLAGVASALDARVAPARIASALSHAAAQRMLRFDADIEWREDVKQSWLWVTHLLTHADAVTCSLERHPGPGALRGLFHSARFINHVNVLDATTTPDLPADGGEGDLLDALARHDVDAALSIARSGLRRDAPSVERALRRSCLASRLVRPIFFQHHVKTVMAAIRVAQKARAIDDELDPDAPILATVRFLAHPLAEQRHDATARTARAFVKRGERPGSLLPY